MNTDFLKFYASQGWMIFPIQSKGKMPLFPSAHPDGDPLRGQCTGACGKRGHGLYDAVSDYDVMAGWLVEFPQMNIGLVTGKRSGVFVLDVDAGHGGLESLGELEKTYGKLPETPTVQTGGGGRHYFFRHPQSVEIHNVQNSGKIAKGIDIRGDGGYVVTAPSIHPNGNKYVWIVKPSEVKLANAPDWLLKAILDEPKEIKQANPLSDNAVIVSGERNNYLASFAGTMRKRGASGEAIRNALIAENKNKCVPMLSDAEVLKIADSVSRYQPVASFEEGRDRAKVEWAFCKSIYEYPSNISDFIRLTPSMFSDKKLGEFWELVIHGETTIDAAAAVGLVTELEGYTEYDFTRLDGYARAIEKFSVLSAYIKTSGHLQAAARDGDSVMIDKAVQEINKIPALVKRRDYLLIDASEDVEKFINARAANPSDVWGIPYAWSRLSKYTGGKQKGEVILFAGEPKKGKSWWCLQDALDTALRGTPVFYWSGEMPKRQIMRRLYQLLGVNGMHMNTGKMTADDWDTYNNAKALILNSPIYVDDTVGLHLHEVRPMLSRLQSEYGIEQFVIDYSSKLIAPGRDEIEQSARISNEIKDNCVKMDLAGILIASVNKEGMDNRAPAMKSNVRGSGQQIHDADVIYTFTSFSEKSAIDYKILPSQTYRCASLNISAGRELSQHIEGGNIPYMRERDEQLGFDTPRWIEIDKPAK